MNITDGGTNAISAAPPILPTINAPTSSIMSATLDAMVESELHAIQQTMESVIVRTKSLNKYLPNDAKKMSTDLITELFELSDKEAIANLLLGNK